MTIYRSTDDIIQDLFDNPIEKGGQIYHPLPFPEFKHLTSSSNAAQVNAKWSMLDQTLRVLFPEGIQDKRVIDIGANAGFFSFSLAQQGANVLAIEPHPRYAAIGRFLAQHHHLPVTWDEKPIELSNLEPQKYEVGLMLSVFQWICQGNSQLTAGKRFLRALSQNVRFLFFELGVNYGKSAIHIHSLNRLAYVYSLLKENSEYSQIKLLGITHLWDRHLSRKTPLHLAISFALQRIHRLKEGRFLFLCSQEDFPLREPVYAFLKHIRI
jgi:hypothetical protein